MEIIAEVVAEVISNFFLPIRQMALQIIFG